MYAIRSYYADAVRTLQRVSIAEIGYRDMYPTDFGIHSDEFEGTRTEEAGQPKPVSD